MSFRVHGLGSGGHYHIARFMCLSHGVCKARLSEWVAGW